MKSFFEKSNIKVNNLDDCDYINFSIKYGLEINKSHLEFDYDWLNGKSKEYLVDILLKIYRFHISAKDLKHLPNNINNMILEMIVWGYNDLYSFPENWNILKLEFTNSNCYPIIKSSFTYKDVLLTASQTSYLAC